ncbi:sodium-coupled neutral amino acid symporter 2-like [Petromyzon marinus]|uniref:Sodium-coupled neutral amino acid transporter 2-like n=1 Tax=Petromyzon marinus TaxID=7757 RepID=A0AAJ7T511_PETMA|nr:sodium-coupled neutral amino acid transporter 2-like [Petromyzon marinus]
MSGEMELGNHVRIPNGSDSDSSDGIGEPRIIDSENVTIATASQYDDQVDTERENFIHHDGKVHSKKHQVHEGKTSYGMSIFNLSNAIMGSGILGLSYAMANTGIILFVVLLFAVAVMSCYSVHLLLETSHAAGTKSYEQLGFLAYKHVGKIAAAAAIMLQNIGAMSSYLYIVKYEMPEVLKSLLNAPVEQQSTIVQYLLNGNVLVIIVGFLVILPLCSLKNIGLLGYTSSFSLACMVFFLIVIVIKKFQIYCWVVTTANQTEVYTFTYDTRVNETLDGTCPISLGLFNFKTAYTIPILTFAFVAHPEILPIYMELKEPTQKKMQQVSNISMFAMLGMYLLTAIFGYLTFYGGVEAELLHTFVKLGGFSIVILLVRLAVLIAVTLTVPVVLFPMRSSVEELFFHTKTFSWLRHIIIAMMFLVLDILLVIFVPSIREIFGFIGSSAGTLLIFILPSLFYLKLATQSLKERIGAIMFCLAGFLLMFASIGLIITEWIRTPVKWS